VPEISGIRASLTKSIKAAGKDRSERERYRKRKMPQNYYFRIHRF
jgi:hypothetical protein